MERVEPDEEMLARVKDFLEDGLFLANDDDAAPIKLVGTRIYYGDAPEPREQRLALPAEPALPVQQVRKEKKQPRSYATVVATVVAAAKISDVDSTVSSRSRAERLSRMVDELVEETGGETTLLPVTPPQLSISHPIIAGSGSGGGGGGGLQYSGQDFIPSHSQQRGFDKKAPLAWSTAATLTSPPPAKSAATLGSPAQLAKHSRVNSASSIRSRASVAGLGAVGERTTTPRLGARVPAGKGEGLLFGAGESVWSSSGGGGGVKGRGGGRVRGSFGAVGGGVG